MSGLLLARPEEAAAQSGQGVPPTMQLHCVQLSLSWPTFRCPPPQALPR